MPRTGLAVAVLLASSPALAFDTGTLGQGGTLPLADLMPTIAKSAPLQREVRQALTASKKTADDVTCDGMRFPGQWVHLGGLRVAPYTCGFGGKWLQIRASVRVTDDNGRLFETVTPAAMRDATRVDETNLTWTWTSEDPFKGR